MTHSAFIRSELRSVLGRLEMVKLTRYTPCESTLSGYALCASEEWLLVWQFNEFWPDGFTLVRIDGIEKVRCGVYEWHWTEMLRDEGIATQLPEPNIAIGPLPSLLNQLRGRETPVILQCEEPNEDIEDFYIGKIIQLDNSGCTFANFDGMGIWDNELHKIGFDEITRIQFDTPYATHFSRHLNRDCPFDANGNWLPVT